MGTLSSSFVERGGIPSTMTVEVLPAAGVGTISSSDADTNDDSVGGLEDDSSGSTARGNRVFLQSNLCGRQSPVSIVMAANTLQHIIASR